MSLRERLEAKGLERSTITVRNEKFVVLELDRAERSRIFADCRDKAGKSNFPKLEGVLLSRCVIDPEDETPVYPVEQWRDWDKLGSGYTGPLFGEVMRLNGLDDQDVGRELKNSDTTDSSG